MHFFIAAIKICHTRIRPTQTSEKIFSMDSLKFLIKELVEQPNPRGWWGGGREGATARPDEIYNVTFYRGCFSSMQLSLGLGIEIREQLLYREGFWEFSSV